MTSEIVGVLLMHSPAMASFSLMDRVIVPRCEAPVPLSACGYVRTRKTLYSEKSCFCSTIGHIVSQVKCQLQQGKDAAFVQCQSNHGIWGLGPCTPHGCGKKMNVHHLEGIRHKYLQQQS